MKDQVVKCVCGCRPNVELRPRANNPFEVWYYVKCPQCMRESADCEKRIEAVHAWNILMARVSRI